MFVAGAAAEPQTAGAELTPQKHFRIQNIAAACEGSLVSCLVQSVSVAANKLCRQFYQINTVRRNKRRMQRVS
jgi:hypothetical protein